MKVIGDWSLSSFVKTLLDIAFYGIAAMMVLVIAITGLLSFSDLGEKATLEVPVRVAINPRTINVNSASLGVQSAEFRDIRANMRFPAHRNMFLLGSFIGLMILLIFILWVVAQLRLVFRSIRNGQPFLPVNAIRIRRIGIAVILGELTRAIATYLSNYYAMMHFSANGIQFTAPIDISVIALVHGLIIIVIAEVFRMGSQLQEDQSLTV